VSPSRPIHLGRACSAHRPPRRIQSTSKHLRRSRVQKIDIQVPPHDPIDLWDFTRLIAKSICPSLREVEGHAWLQQKLEKLPGSDFETVSDMTADERASLLRLLPELPSRAGMSKNDRDVFMDAYLSHPERLPWSPVFVTEEEVTANSFRILQIQEKHLLALQQEIASGQIIALDEHHISETRAGKNIFIRREEALSYLRAHRFRTTEDSGALSTSSAPEPRTPVTRPAASVRAPSADLQRASAAAGPVKTPTRGATWSAAPIAFAEHNTTAPALSPPAKPSAPQKASTALQSSAKNVEASAEPKLQNTVTVILRRRQVEARTSLSRSAIYDRLDPNSPRYDPTFPKQVRLGSSSVGWLESEIEGWLTARARASRQ
jgi:predicted DNA-binding transcriptional regulator AlpA